MTPEQTVTTLLYIMIGEACSTKAELTIKQFHLRYNTIPTKEQYDEAKQRAEALRTGERRGGATKNFTDTQQGTVHVIKPTGFKHPKTNSILWLCECKCGNTVVKTSTNLGVGIKYCSRSCPLKGDGKLDKRSKGTKTYTTWKAMINRCTNPADTSYYLYGGREPVPVTVCREWLGSYDMFVADMGMAPEARYGGMIRMYRTLTEDGYFKANCEWREVAIPTHHNAKHRTEIIPREGVMT